MGIRLAIHHEPCSFSGRWLEYCRELGIEHEIVNAFENDIISRLAGFDGFLWHFTNNEPTDLLMARHVLTVAEHMGLSVFPNTATCWHFDDKIAQKYLLEAIGVPMVPTYVFYEKNSALAWLENATFPLVRKLRRGAGSFNVGLVEDFPAGRKFCNQMFGKGISPALRVFADARRRLTQMRNWSVFRDRLKRLGTHLRTARRRRRETIPERGYVLFQEFIPDNSYDTRITVVGDRAWGFTREVRTGDFRASGSGRIKYDRSKIHPACVEIAFTAARALRSQSTAFDFVLDASGQPLIVEISYGYLPEVPYNAGGFWAADLSWQEGHTWPEHAILEDLLSNPNRAGLTRIDGL